MRLAAPELRSTKYSQLKVMTVKQLREQLSIRKRVDGRKDLLLTPPKDSEEKARRWLILKMQQVSPKPASLRLYTSFALTCSSSFSPSPNRCCKRSSRRARCRCSPTISLRGIWDVMGVPSASLARLAQLGRSAVAAAAPAGPRSGSSAALAAVMPRRRG